MAQLRTGETRPSMDTETEHYNLSEETIGQFLRLPDQHKHAFIGSAPQAHQAGLKALKADILRNRLFSGGQYKY